MIETIITKIINCKETNRQLNEENTKMTLVVPMMEHPGYNPRNLDEIESDAFHGCTSLKEVHLYRGQEELYKNKFGDNINIIYRD